MFYTMAKVEKGTFNDDERSFTAWASQPILDRDNEIIAWDAWDLENWRKNPVLLWAHDYKKFPLGSAQWAEETREGLKFKPQFSKVTQDARIVYNLYKEGTLRAFSVGFDPKKWIVPRVEDGLWAEYEKVSSQEIQTGYIADKGAGWTEERARRLSIRGRLELINFESAWGIKSSLKPDRVYTLCELLEISCVPVGSCPTALVDAYEAGRIKSKAIGAYIEEKTAIFVDITDAELDDLAMALYEHEKREEKIMSMQADLRKLKRGVRNIVG